MLDERPWTTARCSRLLRPLTNSLGSLRIRERSRAHESHVNRGHTCAQGDKSGKNIAYQDSIPSYISQRRSTGEHDWEEFRPRKRVKRTYSSRRNITPTFSIEKESENSGNESRPGEIAVHTPLLNRNLLQNKIKDYKPSSQNGEPQPGCLRSRIGGFLEASRSRNRKMSPVEAVEISFSNLLRQTHVHDESGKSFDKPTFSGTPTLFSLCLRNIPAHIVDEQKWRKEQDPEDKSDVSAEIYELLESLGCEENSGWKPLRQVVRAHGTALILNSLKNTSLPTAHLSSLIDICIQQNALVEAKQLINSWICAQDKFPSPPTPAATYCELLDMLNAFSYNVKSSAFQYRILTSLVQSGKFPIEWTATSAFKDLWYAAIKSMSDQDADSQEATEFITLLLLTASDETTIFASEEANKNTQVSPDNYGISCKDESSPYPLSSLSNTGAVSEFHGALSNTVSSLCTILTAITLTRKDVEFEIGAEKSQNDSIHPVRHAASKFDYQYPTQAAHARNHVLCNRMLICAADMLLAFNDVQCGTVINHEALSQSIVRLVLASDSFDKTSNAESTSSSVLRDFICSVAHCYGRAQGRTGFDFLERTVNHMLEYHPNRGYDQESAPIGFIRRLALDATISFTEASSNPEEVKLANLVEESVKGLLPRDRNTRLQHNEASRPTVAFFDGLRWEEGICEWVAATPATMLKLKTGNNNDFSALSPLNSIRPVRPCVANTPSKIAFQKEASVSSVRDSVSGRSNFKDSTQSNIRPEREEDELDDSGIFMADLKFRKNSVDTNCREYHELPHEDEDEGIQARIMDEEDELAMDDTFEEWHPSFDSRHELGGKKTVVLKSQLSEHRVEQQLQAWDLTSDELG